MSALAEALSYRLDHGLALIPLEPHSKRPNFYLLPVVDGVPRWTPLVAAPADEKQIRAWFSKDPDAGIGIFGGEASGNLVILDFDKELEIDVKTPTSISRPGRSHVFARSTETKSSRHDWGSVIGENSYAAAPPSIHPSGFRRRWNIGLDEAEIAEISRFAGSIEFELIHGRSRGRTQIQVNSSSLLYNSIPVRTGERLPPHEVLREVEIIMILDLLGIRSEVGKTFRCVLPGHSEKHPSTTIQIDKNANLVYHDWHQRDGKEWFTLPEVYASQLNGRCVELSGPSQRKWWDRMRYDAGILKLRGFPLTLFQDPVVRRVANGFLLLLALREASEPGQIGAPYTREFAKNWCGVSEWSARKALTELQRIGFLKTVGWMERDDGVLTSTPLYTARF